MSPYSAMYKVTAENDSPANLDNCDPLEVGVVVGMDFPFWACL